MQAAKQIAATYTDRAFLIIMSIDAGHKLEKHHEERTWFSRLHLFQA